MSKNKNIDDINLDALIAESCWNFNKRLHSNDDNDEFTIKSQYSHMIISSEHLDYVLHSSKKLINYSEKIVDFHNNKEYEHLYYYFFDYVREFYWTLSHIAVSIGDNTVKNNHVDQLAYILKHVSIEENGSTNWKYLVQIARKVEHADPNRELKINSMLMMFTAMKSALRTVNELSRDRVYDEILINIYNNTQESLEILKKHFNRTDPDEVMTFKVYKNRSTLK